MLRNPFTPTFGVVPPHMAGREAILADMKQAFSDGLGNPDLATLLMGARGSGKTALLTSISTVAKSNGWLSVDVACEQGMLEDIAQRTAAEAAHLIDTSPHGRLVGVTVGQLLGMEWETDPSPVANWRSRMSQYLNLLEERDVGLLVTVDEVRAGCDEMIRLASTYQLFVREGKKVALVVAGLPGNVSQLVNDESVSFLRRSSQRHLGRIADDDVREAFRLTVEGAGKRIEDDALDSAVEAIEGFPYMMQLVGYRTWTSAADAEEIRATHVKEGVELARRGMRDGVLAATYRALSPGDRRFLQAMLPDEFESSLSDIAYRLGKTTGYASTYKARLIEQGVVEEAPSGRLRIAMPFMREYLEGTEPLL